MPAALDPPADDDPRPAREDEHAAPDPADAPRPDALDNELGALDAMLDETGDSSEDDLSESN